MITTLYIRRTGDDPEARNLLRRLQKEGFTGLTGVRIEKVYRLEGVDREQARNLRPLLCHAMAEEMSDTTALLEKDAPVFEVGYQHAVTDPELPSVLRGARALGITSLEWMRLYHRYQFSGLDTTTAREIVSRYLFNPQVQVILRHDTVSHTLKPRGETGPVESLSLKDRSVAEMLELSEQRRLFLNEEQLLALQSMEQSMGRPFTDAELEMFAQTWSDHCFHTTWKSLGLLQELWNATRTIDHPLVLSVFEDNAGAMAFYDGWALTIKGETHNSPSAVSPYGGIMTKHGGVIRDTLGCGQGAKPIGGSTVMGLGDPRMAWDEVPPGALHPRTILLESIRGTADYCNPMGIPMMFPVYRFHAGYTGKCLALGHSIGLIPENRAAKGHPVPGDLAVLAGGLTGRDGLHGATVSSSSMTSETAVVDAAHVQIGHPIEERKFMEAIPVLRDAGCLRAVTDLGAAGLSSAAGEMGSETGILIDLARVPLKTEGMHPWEIWISESQERMLLCIPPERLAEALDLLERYEVPASVIGTFTDTQRCQVIHDPERAAGTDAPAGLSGETVVDLAFTDLRKGCPLPDIRLNEPEKRRNTPLRPDPRNTEGWTGAVKKVLSHLNLCDQSAAGNQFDNTIQGIVVSGPYGGVDMRMPNDVWIAAPVRGKPYGAATALGYNPLYGDVDPVAMARLAVIDPVSKLAAAGVRYTDIVLCDNFYTPRITPETGWILKAMVHACCDLSMELGTPFISGKDSSSGTFIGKDGTRLDIPPTLAVLAMGRMPDVRRAIPKPWQKAESRLILAGPLTAELGGSVYDHVHGYQGSRLPEPDTGSLKALWNALAPLQDQGLILSTSAVAEGGLVRRLFEAALGSGLGCRIDLAPVSRALETPSALPALFAEMAGALILEVAEPHAGTVIQSLNGLALGQVTDTPMLDIQTGGHRMVLDMAELVSAWEQPFLEVAQ